eukprot:COSAG01_NODE_3733_length_5751_cov_6.724168_7_plen_51_part_00
MQALDCMHDIFVACDADNDGVCNESVAPLIQSMPCLPPSQRSVERCDTGD